MTSCFAFDKDKAPLKSWRKSKTLESKFCIAVTLACSEPSDAELVEIEGVVDDILDSGVPAFMVLCLDVPCILGDEELRQRILRRARESIEVQQDTLWIAKILEYHNGELTTARWLEYASPYSHELCIAHYIIGMRALLDRDMPAVKKQLQMTLKNPQVGAWAFHSARCYMQKLDAGWVPPNR